MDWDNPMVGVMWLSTNWQSYTGCQFNFEFKNGDVSNAKMPGKQWNWERKNISPEDSQEVSQISKILVFFNDKDERSDESGAEADWIVSGF